MPAACEDRVLEIDGDTVLFHVEVFPVPIPRAFLGYRVVSGPSPTREGVLAAVRKPHPTAVAQEFTDAELIRLYRLACRSDRRR